MKPDESQGEYLLTSTGYIRRDIRWEKERHRSKMKELKQKLKDKKMENKNATK